MAMTISDASDINTVLRWAMGAPTPGRTGRTPDEDATHAARRLAGKANKVLLAGLRPGQVILTHPEPVPAEDSACPYCGHEARYCDARHNYGDDDDDA